MKLLLDTNAYSEWKRGNPLVIEIVRGAQWIGLSAVVIGELLHGFRYGSRYSKNRHELDAFLADPDVHFLAVGLLTADRYARVFTQLRQAGTPIPSNDVWIAAHTFEHGAELVTFDSHFEVVAGLPLLNPTG